ncbi:MAG: hydroxymethylbilane synthase [Cyanobacteria bacterium]|nr:hydroxymethylbilane synthase [Cyanobacteriota bacterium]
MIRVGSRDSVLAVTQAELVIDWLTACGHPSQLLTFKTQGDYILDQALSAIGDKGLFVKELEEALLSDKIDMAVHSMKDMPGTLPDGLLLSSIFEREDPRDVVILSDRMRKNGISSWRHLPSGACVGTSSLRRVAQLKRHRPDLYYVTVRGNLQTRLRKLNADEAPDTPRFDALILAAAGVNRLGWQEKIAEFLAVEDGHVPAVCQGILAIETSQQDVAIDTLLAPAKQPAVEIAMAAERAVLTTLQGGCQIPLGAYALPKANSSFELNAMLLNLDGTQYCWLKETFSAMDEGISAGNELGKALLKAQARDFS